MKSSLRWKILYFTAGVVDAFQTIASATGYGIALSELLEVITPFLLVAIMGFFRILTIRKVYSLIIAGGTDALTFGFLPLWVADVAYIHWSTNREESSQQQKSKKVTGQVRREPDLTQPLNQNGVRLPSREYAE